MLGKGLGEEEGSKKDDHLEGVHVSRGGTGGGVDSLRGAAPIVGYARADWGKTGRERVTRGKEGNYRALVLLILIAEGSDFDFEDLFLCCC